MNFKWLKLGFEARLVWLPNLSLFHHISWLDCGAHTGLKSYHQTNHPIAGEPPCGSFLPPGRKNRGHGGWCLKCSLKLKWKDKLASMPSFEILADKVSLRSYGKCALWKTMDFGIFGTKINLSFYFIFHEHQIPSYVEQMRQPWEKNCDELHYSFCLEFTY